MVPFISDHSSRRLQTGLRRPIGVGLLLILLLWAPGATAQWQEYQADYAVYRNGKHIGEVTFALTRQTDTQWLLTSVGKGSRGLARLLGATHDEWVSGRLENGHFRPERFSHYSRVAGFDEIWQASFDWQNRAVAITQGNKSHILNFEADALDGLSMRLEMQRRLRDQETDLTFFKVDEDAIKPQHYRQLPVEYLDTSLGCLSTVPVERVRTQSTRSTRAWHAPALEFLIVRTEDRKASGELLKLRITRLVFGDCTVPPTADCATPAHDPS